MFANVNVCKHEQAGWPSLGKTCNGIQAGNLRSSTLKVTFIYRSGGLDPKEQSFAGLQKEHICAQLNEAKSE